MRSALLVTVRRRVDGVGSGGSVPAVPLECGLPLGFQAQIDSVRCDARAAGLADGKVPPG